MPDKPSYLSLIKNKGFRYLWINQILVQLAYNTLNFALIIWVFKLTDSSLAVSALMLAIYLPSLIFGVFAGVFVDILDRRRIILMIDLSLALAIFALLFAKQIYPLILLDVFIINTLAQFFMPSESSSIPMLVSRRQLFLANSLFSLTLYGSLMLGYSLGGPILNTFGLNAIFFLGSFLLLFAFLLARNLPTIRVTGARKSYGDLSSRYGLQKVISLTVRETKKTYQFINGRLNVAVAIGLMALVQGVIGMLAVMMPSYLEKVLLIHASDSSYFVMIPLGLGMVSGALLSGRIFHGMPRRSIVIPAILGAGLVFILAGFAPVIAKWFSAADLSNRIIRPRYFFRAPSLSSFFALLAFLLGFFNVMIILPCQTVLQENTPEKNRGKIFAVLAVLMTAFSAIPIILAGGLADAFGVTPLFVAMGVTILIVGLVARRPNIFFEEDRLPLKLKEFLGVGHWAK